MTMPGAWLARREPGKGTLILFFDRDGKPLGQMPYDEWRAGAGPELKPGTTVECTCRDGAIYLNCPLHAVDLGSEMEGL